MFRKGKRKEWALCLAELGLYVLALLLCIPPIPSKGEYYSFRAAAVYITICVAGMGVASYFRKERHWWESVARGVVLLGFGFILYQVVKHF